MTENHPQHPISPYGESKLTLERALRWYGTSYGFRCITLRYFNAAGADLDGEIGECHHPETHVIPLAIRASFPSGEPLSVFGVDYPTPDKTAIRDYIHVADLAQAHVLALQYLRNGNPSATFNLGTGTGYSVKDLVRMIEAVRGASIKIKELPRRPGDPPALIADASRASQELGWRPKYSDLRTLIETAVRWECNGIQRHFDPCGRVACADA
jgi:UDP-glucose-4-epimerase GalE